MKQSPVIYLLFITQQLIDQIIQFNLVQFFIIHVPSQQQQGQLQTQHSVDTINYIMDNHNLKPKTNYRQALEENALMQRNKQTK
jgi:hypothetical protein